MSECNCHSYNADIGSMPEVQLVPFWDKDRTICIDACIAHVIEHLWKHKIETRGSCCGHGGVLKDNPFGGNPNIILATNTDVLEANRIRGLIREVDRRDFVFLSWKLCEI